MLRAKRSLMISIVGMRPRTMRSWLDDVVVRTSPFAALLLESSGFRR